MNGFVFSVNQYLNPKDRVNAFLSENRIANPEKIDYGRAVTDLVCEENYWGIKSPSEPASTPKSWVSFVLSKLFSGPTDKTSQIQIKTAPALCDAKMTVRMDDVSCYADDFNGNDMRRLKADVAKEIASRLRTSLISVIEPAAQKSSASSLWDVSQVTKTGSTFEITAQIPETILSQMRQGLQRHIALTR